MKAIIGINLDISGERPKAATIQANYYECISKAGGIPLLIPPVSDQDILELVNRLDGLLFIGGNDYCPSRYGEERHESVELAHDERIDFDLRLMQAALNAKRIPILGICAGCQLLNIGLGGSLHQDIPTDFPESKVQHSTKNGWNDGFNRHRVKLRQGTKLFEIYTAKEFDVPTSHHQAVKKLGAGLIGSAEAEDGILEAVELEGQSFVIGVQWHPERDYQGNAELFKSFIKAASARLVETGPKH